MKFKESTLKLYAAPLSSTEDAKCKRAIEAIRDALKDLGYTDDQKDIGLLESDTLSYSIRFLYKGIIINHNKKPSQPTLKRRFFKKKAAFFSWPGLGKEWC